MSNRKKHSEDVPARSKSSLGFRANRSSPRDVPKRSQTPAFERSSRHGSKEVKRETFRRKGRANALATIPDESDNEDGGAALSRSAMGTTADGTEDRMGGVNLGQRARNDGYGTLGRQSIYDDDQPIQYNTTIIPDILNPATDEFYAQESHAYWKWSIDQQLWYHIDETTGEIIWDRPLA